MSTETKVYFGVFNFGGDPSVITKLLGVNPSEAWVKGEKYSDEYPDAVRTHDRWVLYSGLPKTAPFEEQITALVDLLEQNADKVRKVSDLYYTQIGVAQYISEVNPQFDLSAEIIERIASLGLAIWFDQYFLDKDDSDS